jgi:hypothetical protein
MIHVLATELRRVLAGVLFSALLMLPALLIGSHAFLSSDRTRS